jgi:hypothetical protein
VSGHGAAPPRMRRNSRRLISKGHLKGHRNAGECYSECRLDGRANVRSGQNLPSWMRAQLVGLCFRERTNSDEIVSAESCHKQNIMQCNKSIEVCTDEFSVAIGEIVGVIIIRRTASRATRGGRRVGPQNSVAGRRAKGSRKIFAVFQTHSSPAKFL